MKIKNENESGRTHWVSVNLVFAQVFAND